MKNSEIRESRLFSIKDKVISSNKLKALAIVLWDEFNTLDDDEKERAYLNFSLASNDASKFDSGNISVFNDDSVIYNKRIVAARLTFNFYRDGKQIDISLYHGDSHSNNYIEITGKDSLWVNGIFTKLREIIFSFEPQNTFVRKHSLLLISMCCWCAGLIVFQIMGLALPTVLSAKFNKINMTLHEISPFFIYICRYLLALIFGIVGCGFSVYGLFSQFVFPLWPSIEFQIGPEHTLIEKKQRIVIGMITTMCILPFLLSVIYDVIKAVIN